jgi:GNAT superfamily N-acetyltransferase
MSSPAATSAQSVQSAEVVVRPISSPAEKKAFVRFAKEIYQNDSAWAEPLEIERLEFIDPKRHPFYTHGVAQLFLAKRGDKIVGRIMASDDPHYNAEHGSNIGCFGLFEAIDDPAVARALLDAAKHWLLARGRTDMLGPIEYSTNYSCGLLIDGFDTPPRVMMNHNPRYYLGLLESYGLEKAKDLYSWWFDDRLDMLAKWRKRADRLAGRGIVVRSFKRKDIASEVMRCRAIYNEAWQKNWGFVRMSDAEFAFYGKFLQQMAVPELLLLAEVDGRPAGFSLTLPDFNEAVAPLHGRLCRYGLPLGAIQLMRNLKRIHSCRLVTFGIKEEYRRRGIAELLILRTLDYGKNSLNYTGAELGWTLEDNDGINRPIAEVGGVRYKTYRIYQKRIS